MRTGRPIISSEMDTDIEPHVTRTSYERALAKRRRRRHIIMLLMHADPQLALQMARCWDICWPERPEHYSVPFKVFRLDELSFVSCRRRFGYVSVSLLI
eukprot:m.705852 g.705852  ORF g.705852 m.705852 type:complete len:99 (+) comp58723_c0_seq78:959-1255(+)